MAKNDNGVVEFQFYRPESRTKWQNFQRAIYDPQSKQCLGRTPKNWGQLLLFYTIFYAVLAALFAACMQGLFATLDDREPRWKLDRSLIGTNPGLGFRPISAKTEEGSLIWYDLTNKTTSQKWVDLIDTFLMPYKANQTGDNYEICGFDRSLKEGKVCEASVKEFGECTPEKNYGYSTNSPCVFLKLNRIFGWVPDFYTEPIEEMPLGLKNYISETKETERKQIWVSCNGLDDVDKENIRNITYFPQGFHGYYYPYKNFPNYLSPIVAVKINVNPNVIVSIECRSWARNIQYKGGSLNRAGSITFEIQVDAPSSNATTI